MNKDIRIGDSVRYNGNIDENVYEGFWKYIKVNKLYKITGIRCDWEIPWYRIMIDKNFEGWLPYICFDTNIKDRYNLR